MLNNQNTNNAESINSGMLTFKDLLDTLMEAKFFIISLTVISIISSIIFALSQEDIYKSKSLVSVQGSGDSGISSSLSQYSGLANMAGIRLPSGSNSSDKASLIIETISSRIFFKSLIEKYVILPAMMASKGYDKKSQELIYDSSSFDQIKSVWLKKEPSFTKSHQVFLGMLSLRQDPKTKFISIEIDHQSPFFAHFLLDTIIQEINITMRNQDLQETQLAIDYLSVQVGETQIQDLRKSFNALITAQLEKKMMADIKKEYALKIIDPPNIPEFKFKPQRSTIVIFSTLFGFFISIFIVFFRKFLQILRSE
tara:strand:+ start:928 stop:1860 length:933 start_codon:yes stop_codon:yes gene_type:complete